MNKWRKNDERPSPRDPRNVGGVFSVQEIWHGETTQLWARSVEKYDFKHAQTALQRCAESEETEDVNLKCLLWYLDGGTGERLVSVVRALANERRLVRDLVCAFSAIAKQALDAAEMVDPSNYGDKEE